MKFNISKAFQSISIAISIIECEIDQFPKCQKSIFSMRTAFSGTSVTPDFTKIVCWRTSVAYSMWLVDLASFPPGLRVILFSGRGQLAGSEKSTFLYGGRWFSGSFSGSLHSFGISFWNIKYNYCTTIYLYRYKSYFNQPVIIRIKYSHYYHHISISR